MMTTKITQKEINDKLWTCCDVFRGNISANVYKDYILVMLFIKYLSDIYESKEEKLVAKYKGDLKKVDKIMARERFSIPKGTHFKRCRLLFRIGQHTWLDKIYRRPKRTFHCGC